MLYSTYTFDNQADTRGIFLAKLLASYISSYSRSCWFEPFWKLLIKLYRLYTPLFFGCEQHRLACSVVGQKIKTFSLNGGHLMVMNPMVESVNKQHIETTKLMVPSDDSPRLNENQPFFNGENHQRVPTPPCHTEAQLCHTEGLGAPELLLLGIPEALGDLDVFFLVVCKKPRRWWWLPQVENFQNGNLTCSFFTFWCHVEVWCWT